MSKAKQADAPAAIPDSTTIVLRYVGRGAWLPNVPARDLTEADIVALEAASVATEAFLRACSLYEPVDNAAPGAPEER